MSLPLKGGFERLERWLRLKSFFLLQRTRDLFSVPIPGSSPFSVTSFPGDRMPYGPPWYFCMYMVRINSCRYTHIHRVFKKRKVLKAGKINQGLRVQATLPEDKSCNSKPLECYFRVPMWCLLHVAWNSSFLLYFLLLLRNFIHFLMRNNVSIS